MGEANSGMRERLEALRERIEGAARRAGRNPDEVKLVAVTKTVAAERIREAVEAGVGIVGENYVQEAERKQEALGGRSVPWHMIGTLQSNKAANAVRVFDVFETVDRPKIAQALDRHAGAEGRVLEVLLQVNVSGEATKSGVAPEEAPGLLEAVGACAHLRCVGLMTMPPFFDDPDRARPVFSRLRELGERLRAHPGADPGWGELSMGMSGDFEVAIEEGATLVRIGTALFGARG